MQRSADILELLRHYKLPSWCLTLVLFQSRNCSNLSCRFPYVPWNFSLFVYL